MSATSANAEYLKSVQATEKANTVTISPIQGTSASQIEAAFGVMKQERTEALIVLGDAFFSSQAHRITELAAQHRLPTMFWTLGARGVRRIDELRTEKREHYYRAATYIDKILKGAKPGDPPVEQPTKVELVINLKTAKAIGLTIPQQLLLQADKVIE